MPAKSAKQRSAASMALAIKMGKLPASKAKGAVKSMLSMSEQQLREFAVKEHMNKVFKKGK